MLDMAPPRVHSNTQLPFPAITNVITYATRIPIATGLESSSDTGEDIVIGYPLNLILRHWLRGSRKRNTGQNHRMDAPIPHSSLLPTTDAIDSAFAGSSLKSLLKTEKLLPSLPACKWSFLLMSWWKSLIYFHFSSCNALYLNWDKSVAINDVNYKSTILTEWG